MSSVYSYDTNNQEIYTGYGQYNVEHNALITEEQLNDTEKDIRDYLEKLKSELTDYMKKLKYVSYSYYQNLSTVEQDTAQKNIDFPGRIQGLTKHYFDSYYQDALTRVMSNLNLVNSVESNLISGNARIYYLSENFKIGTYGMPVYAENFVDIYPQDLFYHKNNYDNSKYKWNNLNLQQQQEQEQEEQNNYFIPHFDSNSEQENHIYHFANFVENLQKTGLNSTAIQNFNAGLVDRSYGEGIRGYIELNPRPNLSYFLPEILSKIKAGDILYCPANQKTFIVKARETGLQGVRTWWNSDKTKSLMNIDKAKLDENFSILYNPGSVASKNDFQNNYLSPIRTRLKSIDYLNEDNPQLVRITNNCIYYWDTYNENYEYGCLSIYCEEISSLVLQPSLWEYNGSTLFGGGEEYPNNFTKLFGANNFITRPVIGDIIYNPLSQEYRRVVRDLTKSERFLAKQTYLTEPVIQYTNGELDNSLRALATYGRGTSLFAIPKEYDICLTNTEIGNGTSNAGIFRNNFARIINACNVDTNKESYESTNDTSTTSVLGRKQALSAIIYDHNTGEIYPAKTDENISNYIEPYNHPRILFNTYFMIPGILQEAETTNFGNIHPLRLGMVHPGDIIQYDEHSYQVTTQPYLKVFTFAEAKQYLITFGYIGNNNNYTSGSLNSTRTTLGDLLFTLFYNMNSSNCPNSESIRLVEGFKYQQSLTKIQYGSGTNDYYSFENIDQWLDDLGNTELVQAYALNAYNNGTILDYLDNLYHRLFTNLDRPIIVEAIPLGDKSCFGQGDSAYEIYKQTTQDNPIKNETEWLASLQGSSAYEIYKQTTQDNPIKNEQAWLASLHGTNGARGPGITNITSTVVTDENETEIGIQTEMIYGENGTSITLPIVYYGKDGASINSITATQVTPNTNVSINYGNNQTCTFTIKDGSSPIINITPAIYDNVKIGYTLTIENPSLQTQTTATILDGISPEVDITPVYKSDNTDTIRGYELSVLNAHSSSPTTVLITNGEDGEDGQNGIGFNIIKGTYNQREGYSYTDLDNKPYTSISSMISNNTVPVIVLNNKYYYLQNSYLEGLSANNYLKFTTSYIVNTSSTVGKIEFSHVLEELILTSSSSSGITGDSTILTDLKIYKNSSYTETEIG